MSNMSRKLLFAAVFLAVINSRISAPATAAAAAAPEPAAKAAGRAAGSSDPRAEWADAVKRYNDKVFKPGPQARIDAADSPLVMLQGFHWYSPDGWWDVLARNAGEIGREGFGLVWFPPASDGSYYSRIWYNLDSQWGKKDALLRAVNAMHAAGVKVIADVVLNHRTGTTNWLDFKNPDWPTSVIVNDDEVWSLAAYSGLPRSPNPDEGQGEHGCRDLDHRDPIVRRDAVVFLRWLRNTIGFDGWRYDMVRGYAPHHIKEYNEASSPVFSVGEYLDGDRELVTEWIDRTDDSPGKANVSSAFDYPLRYSLVAAVESDSYGPLNDNGTPSGVIGWWPSKAVTFVENHDTSPRDPAFIQTASKQYRDQRAAAYAYILTHPGVPCVFWPHFFDWGETYKGQLRSLIAVRRDAGITSTSPVRVISAVNGRYAAVITGNNRRVALRLGSGADWDPGPGWLTAAAGEKYHVWTHNLK